MALWKFSVLKLSELYFTGVNWESCQIVEETRFFSLWDWPKKETEIAQLQWIDCILFSSVLANHRHIYILPSHKMVMKVFFPMWFISC